MTQLTTGLFVALTVAAVMVRAVFCLKPLAIVSRSGLGTLKNGGRFLIEQD